MRGVRALGLLVVGLTFARPVHAQVERRWTDINPSQSSLHAIDPDGASGGRVNGLGRSANGAALYAATEMGGLYKSTDSGLTWAHLAGHLPMVTWDVEVDPSNANRVYATSWYDGKVNSLAGISVSNDAGVTWSKPSSATPAVGFCDGEDRRDNPSAFGIAIDPAAPSRVFVGTNCGLAISLDAGATWRFADPTSADGADDVLDVVVHHGGIIDMCGSDGHSRSVDAGVTWTVNGDLANARCSIAASPDESHVLIAVFGTTIRESDDGGATWGSIITNPLSLGRIPFVAINDRAGDTFDLWFGDVRLHRASCTTPATPSPGGTPRCPTDTWAGSYTRDAGAHDDAGDMVFASGSVTDACPILFSSDGGVYLNTQTASPACHAPQWTQPNVTPHALRTYSMAGAHQPGTSSEDLYLGLQDNGSYATTNAGDALPTWANRDCCDIYNIVASALKVVSSCCGSSLLASSPGMLGGGNMPNLPPGNLFGYRYQESIAAFGPNSYAAVTTSGVYITTDSGASAWTRLGGTPSPDFAKNIWVSVSGGTPTFYVQTGDGSGRNADGISRFVGTGAGSWQTVTPPGGVGGFNVFTVDPVNPNRLFASHVQPNVDPAMVRSSDGGATWTPLPALDNLMTRGGIFRYRNTRGPVAFGSSAAPGLSGYPMPTLVAFDSVDANVMIAGGAESGVFLSLDAGATWEAITDPLDPTASGIPHLPRPVFAYVDHEPPQALNQTLTIYVGTDGRGVWRFTQTTRNTLPGVCGINLSRCIIPQLDTGRITLVCAVDPSRCRFRDELPRNCLLKWGGRCPACETAGLCPPVYDIYLDSLDLDVWEVALFSRQGVQAPHEVVKTKTGAVVSFRPSRDLYRAGSIGDYSLVFAMKPGGRPGRYAIRARLDVASEPYSARAAKAPRD